MTSYGVAEAPSAVLGGGQVAEVMPSRVVTGAVHSVVAPEVNVTVPVGAMAPGAAGETTADRLTPCSEPKATVAAPGAVAVPGWSTGSRRFHCIWGCLTPGGSRRTTPGRMPRPDWLGSSSDPS